MREWQGTINWEHDGRIVDKHIQATVVLLQKVCQLLDGILAADVQLVKLDLHTILSYSIIQSDIANKKLDNLFGFFMVIRF